MRKNIFNQAYVGPSGPHLNCLTETTMFGDFTADHQRSLSSGSGKSYKGVRRDGEGRICAPRNPKRKGALERTLKKLEKRRQDFDHTINSSKTITEGTYTRPGSMQH